MGKTILAEIDGWTPVIDGLAKELGAITALVFGRMWRYCQGDHEVCDASLERIASDLNLDRATIMRHAKLLCENGYLEDLTPGLRNVPHSYADTGKAMIFIKIGVALRNTPKAVAHSNATVAHSNKSVAESKLKIESRDNKESFASPKNGDAREAGQRKQTEQAVLKSLSRQNGSDLHDWPEDTRPVIQAVCDEFNLHPPGSKKSKAYWIAQSRELLDACGEWGTRAIKEYREDFVAFMDSHQGLAPHTVEGPGSLVKVVRAKSGSMRGLTNKDTSEMSDREYRQYLEKYVWSKNE